MSTTPRPAPLPDYQRNYPRDRYPDPARQTDLHRQYYRHQPADGIVQEHQQRLEERSMRPSRQWSVPAPKGGEPSGWNRGTIVVPPSAEPRPQWHEAPSWRQERNDDAQSVPPVLQRNRVIRMDGGWQRQDRDEPEVKRFRGSTGIIVDEHYGTSVDRERRGRDNPREGQRSGGRQSGEGRRER